MLGCSLLYFIFAKKDTVSFPFNGFFTSPNKCSRYFSTPYPLPKMDMVAVPEFAGGAMENYGLIIFRETELLLDELHSAAANIQRVCEKVVL